MPALIVTGVVLTTGRVLPLALLGAVLLAAALLALAVYWRWHARRREALARFRRERPGKDLLLVYTDSPHWRPYIDANWLPRWGERAAVLNRSAPWKETQPEAELWRSVAGPYEHTPLAVVVPPRGRPKVVRFYSAFRDFKHGKDARLRAAEAELRAALDAAGGTD